MSLANKIINTIRLDDEKIIHVQVHPKYQSYLANDKAVRLIKETLIETLRGDLVTMDVGKTEVRVTVKEGKEEVSMKKIETEIQKKLGNPLLLLKLLKN